MDGRGKEATKNMFNEYKVLLNSSDRTKEPGYVDIKKNFQGGLHIANTLE